MAVTRLTLPPTPPAVEWVVDGLVPAGYVSVLFAKQGEGKTRLLAFLATQVLRPAGKFAGLRVRHGKVVVLDADDPGGLGYKLWFHRYLHVYQDANRDLLDLRGVEGGLTPEDLEALQKELSQTPPALIILDAFSSAFLGIDVVKPHHVHAPIRALTALAQATGAAVVLVDHVGKLAPGQTVAEKGPLGSIAKLFSPRAAFALDRLPPREVDGRDVVKLTCVKQSYAPLPPPIGLELVWTQDGQGAYYKPFALPEAETLEDRAAEAAIELLTHSPEGIPRRKLIQEVVRLVNVSEATVRRALAALRTRGLLVEETLQERGRPIIYRLVSTNQENTVQDEADLSSHPLSTNPPFEHKSGGGMGTPTLEEVEWI